jgi:hypothetical protein
MGLNLVGAATGAARVGQQQEEDLQTMLARAFAQKQAEAQMELQRQAAARAEAAQAQSAEQFTKRLEFDTNRETADQTYRQGQVERQGRLDDVAATDRRQVENERGVRRMIGEFLVQRGSTPLDTGARQTLGGMAIQEGVELPKTVTDDPTAANAEWERRQGIEHKNRLGEIAAQGAQTRQNTAARTNNAPDPAEAASITKTALDLAGRLETHPGIGRATGAYEMRGFTQDAVDFNAIRDQLVAALALPNLGALKGPMSDKDVLFVKQLATRLSNPSLSEAETRTAIAEAKTFLNGKLGAAPTPPAPVTPGGGAGARTGGPGPGPVQWGRDAQGRPVRLQ